MNGTTRERLAETFSSVSGALAPMRAGARLMLACSAGGDSMALLELASRLAPVRRWTLAVAHLDHAQRPESAAEAGFVSERAAAHGLICFVARLPDCPASEDELRRARHAWFRRCSDVFRADALALAHQADDQAETLLIRLLAGSGPTGLAAMRPVEEVEGLTLVRPLLRFRRDELRSWLTEQQLEWHDDPGNTGEANKRAWIRNRVLPLCNERLGADITPRLARAAELIGEEAAAFDQAVQLILARLAQDPPAPACAALRLEDPLWREAGSLLRRQLLRRWLWSLRGGHPPGYAAVAEALAFVERAQPGTELRTIDRMQLMHNRRLLLAFPREVEPAARRVLWMEFSAHEAATSESETARHD